MEDCVFEISVCLLTKSSNCPNFGLIAEPSWSHRCRNKEEEEIVDQEHRVILIVIQRRQPQVEEHSLFCNFVQVEERN